MANILPSFVNNYNHFFKGVMNLPKLFLYGISLIIFFIVNNSLHASWDPQTCVDTKNSSAIDLLHDQKFLDLKKQVVDYLQKSWCTEEKVNLMMDLIVLTQPKVCVEIGVFTGSSFLPMVAALSFLENGTAYAIDSWSNFEAIKGIPTNDQNYKWWSVVNMWEVKKLFLNTMDKWSFSKFYVVIPTSSKLAASKFDQIDFLHIDGNFSEQGSLEDVLFYLPKVVPGGYILLSNLFLKLDNQYPKMKSLSVLLEECEIIAEIDNSNAVLFQKHKTSL